MNQKIRIEKVKEQHGSFEQLLQAVAILGDVGKTTNTIKKLIKFTMLSLSLNGREDAQLDLVCDINEELIRSVIVNFFLLIRLIVENRHGFKMNIITHFAPFSF